MPETLIPTLTAALADPFRIALIVALVATQRRTATVTGRWLPLAAGVVFVAVLLPTTMGTAAGTPLAIAIAAGIAANVAILLPVLLAFALWDRRGG
jgi:hypothetical protein